MAKNAKNMDDVEAEIRRMNPRELKAKVEKSRVEKTMLALRLSAVTKKEIDATADALGLSTTEYLLRLHSVAHEILSR
jgi:hypothetical protein